jgi:hypothetical protein
MSVGAHYREGVFARSGAEVILEITLDLRRGLADNRTCRGIVMESKPCGGESLG